MLMKAEEQESMLVFTVGVVVVAGVQDECGVQSVCHQPPFTLQPERKGGSLINILECVPIQTFTRLRRDGHMPGVC